MPRRSLTRKNTDDNMPGYVPPHLRNKDGTAPEGGGEHPHRIYSPWRSWHALSLASFFWKPSFFHTNQIPSGRGPPDALPLSEPVPSATLAQAVEEEEEEEEAAAAASPR